MTSKLAIDEHLRPRRLEGFSPTPTGTTHVITVTQDDYQQILELTARADQCQRWDDEKGLADAREALQHYLPAAHQPGDHCVIRVVPRTQVLVTR